MVFCPVDNMSGGYCIANDTYIIQAHRKTLCSSDASNFTVLPRWSCPNENYCAPSNEKFPFSYELTPDKNESWSELVHNVNISNLLDGSQCKYLIKYPSIGGPNDTLYVRRE